MTLTEIQRLRAQLIRMGHDRIPVAAGRSAERLYEAIVDQILQQLDLSQGRIIRSANNTRLITLMDSIFSKFRREELFSYANQVIRDLEKIKNLNKQYFGIIRSDEGHREVVSETRGRSPKHDFSTASGWSSVVGDVNDLLDHSLGVTAAGNIRKGAFMDRFIQNNTVRAEIKRMASQAVNGELSLRDFQKQFKNELLGRRGVLGTVESYYRQFAFDLYQQHDRLSQKKYAQNLSLKAFRYSGVRIQNSRDFCIKRKDQVFLVSETVAWKSDPDLPKEKSEKGMAKGYDPLVELGRWNCIDHTNFLTDARAIQLRPELADML